ncbi:MAG: hypothetical protein J5654_11285 [Victivallales bacterium]|nr:hypothetical protein [Victivallales bacterium]
MRLIQVPIDSLRPPDYLTRRHDSAQLARFLAAYRKNGQYQPIVAAGGEILCGTLVWQAMKAAGETRIWVNDLGDIPPEKRKEIRYLDNQIFDIETWDAEAMKRLLMDTDAAALSEIGFTKEEAELLVNDEGAAVSGAARGRSKKLKTLWKCDACGWHGELPKTGART